MTFCISYQNYGLDLLKFITGIKSTQHPEKTTKKTHHMFHTVEATNLAVIFGQLLNMLEIAVKPASKSKLPIGKIH